MLLSCPVSLSPFPDHTLHSKEAIVLNNLHNLGYRTTHMPQQDEVRKQIPFHSLMPHACDFSKIDKLH